MHTCYIQGYRILISQPNTRLDAQTSKRANDHLYKHHRLIACIFRHVSKNLLDAHGNAEIQESLSTEPVLVMLSRARWTSGN